MSYSDAIALEADWFALTGAAASGMPELDKATGGPFDVVTPYLRRLAQRPHALYLAHGPSREAPSSKATRRIDHEVIAVVLWAATGAGGRAGLDQAAADAAIVSVVARVAGPVGDVGHAGRWFRIGPTSVEPAGPLELLRFADAIGAAGAAYTVLVRYSCAEIIPR